MSSIPYNYGKYINDKVALRDQGHVSASKQIQSPASAGSRGLAKTTQFTNDRTQMQMGNTTMSESIIEIRNILNRIDGVNVPVQEDDGDERAIAAMKLARDENRKEGFDYPQGGKYGYKAERGSGTGVMGTMQVNVTIHNRETDEIMYIKDMNYLELEKGDEQETLAMIWDENRDLIQKESAVQEKRDNSDIDIRKLLVDISSMKDRIAELAIDDDAKTSAFTALAQVEDDIAQEIQGKFPEAVKEDLDYRSEDILNKAGFDPADIDTYMKVFNDHGDTSDLEQMNMKEKVGLAEVMSIVLASHGIQNESYEPFPEEDEMTFEDDDAFYEAFGELGFPEDETELFDAEYRGRKVPLNKPMRGDVKKFKVYVKDPKTGNVKKVNFGHGGSSARKAGQKTMKIRKSNPKARKSFRARHNCANPGPKTKARYWSCRKW